MVKRTDARTLTPQKVAEIIAPVMEKWGAERAWLYGSVARGDQHRFSDVDLTVELLPGHEMGMAIVTFEDELSDALGLPVDLHSPPDPLRANPVFVRNYERAKVLVYECPTGR